MLISHHRRKYGRHELLLTFFLEDDGYMNQRTNNTKDAGENDKKGHHYGIISILLPQVRRK
jgi:hypothetical protein